MSTTDPSTASPSELPIVAPMAALPHGYKFWRIFSFMDAVDTAAQTALLWWWWDHISAFFGGRNFFLYYVTHPMFSVEVGTIGLFQLIRVIMFTKDYIRNPHKDLFNELVILIPGVISMNFAISCIIWGSFSASGITKAGLGLMVGAHAPAISFFFVAGAALIFLKKLFYDVIFSAIQIGIIKFKYRNQTMPDMAQATIDALKSHIKTQASWLPLWTSIVFAVLLCFTLPALYVTVPAWLSLIGALAIIGGMGYYTFKVDVQTANLDWNSNSLVPLWIAVSLGAAACFVLPGLIATAPWWISIVGAAALVAITWTITFSKNRGTGIEQIKQSAGLSTGQKNASNLMKQITPPNFDSAAEKNAINKQLQFINHELNLSEKGKPWTIRFMNLFLGRSTYRKTNANNALTRLNEINANPAQLLKDEFSPEAITGENKVLHLTNESNQVIDKNSGAYNQVAFDALVQIKALIDDAEKTTTDLKMTRTLAIVKEILVDENNQSKDGTSKPKTSAGILGSNPIYNEKTDYTNVFNAVSEIFHFKAGQNGFTRSSETQKIYETIAGHANTLANSSSDTSKHLGRIEVKAKDANDDNAAYRVLSVRRYVEGRIEQLKRQYAKGMRSMQWYRYEVNTYDIFDPIWTKLTDRCIKTFLNEGMQLVLLDSNNQAVNLPEGLFGQLKDMTKATDIETYNDKAEEINAHKFLRWIAPGSTVINLTEAKTPSADRKHTTENTIPNSMYGEASI